MRLALFGSRKEDPFASPLVGHSYTLHQAAQPIHGVRPDRFASVDAAHPPVFRAIASRSDKQQMLAIRRPDRMAGERKIRLDPSGLSSLRGDHEYLPGAECGTDVLRPCQFGEGDPFSMRSKLRPSALFGHQSGSTYTVH